MEKNIIQPSYYKGIGRNCVGIQEKLNIFASDTETKPFRLIGIGDSKNIEIKKLTYKNFLKLIDKNSKEDECNITSFHNLKFDMQVIFLRFKKNFKSCNCFELYFDSKFNYISDQKRILKKDYYCRVKLFFSKTWFMNISFSKNRRCLVIDSYSFLKGSLYNLSLDLNLPVKKYKIDFNTTNKKELIQYLKNDVLTQYYLTERIIDFHKEYDVRICVSIAQLAARIFRHKFIKKEDSIPIIPHELLSPILQSYHGGKNTYIYDSVKFFKDYNYYDINSLYPHAMKEIPNFLNCSYHMIDHFDKDKEGAYIITGDLKKSIYAIFYSHGFDKIDNRYKGNEYIIDKGDYFHVKNLCVTSYELKKALEYNLINLNSCKGIIIEESKNSYNPLVDYVDHFYQKKKETKEWEIKNNKSHPFYSFYKTCMTSLYGKFIQNLDYSKPDLDEYIEKENGQIVKKSKIFMGGGLFNPLIATLITGFSRALMFDYENKYSSIHTATDSIMTQEKIKCSNQLGDMKLEDFGDVIIFRGKCYVFFGENGVKSARHGFYGTTEDLIRMYINKATKYKATRFINIKESLRCKDRKAAEFQELSYNFNVKYD